MQIDKQLESFLCQYLKRDFSIEEKKRLNELMESTNSLDETLNSVLVGATPEEVEKLLPDKSLMSIISSISEEDEAQIELYFSGLMENTEEEKFKKRLIADGNLRNNILAQAFLYKAIERITKDNHDIIESAKDITDWDIRNLIDELRNEEYDDLIDKYVTGQLSTVETQDFISELQSNDKLKERTAITVMLSKGIQKNQENTQKIIADAKKIEIQDIKDAIGHHAIWYIRKVAAIAIIVVLFGGLGLDYYNYSQISGTANECMDGMMTAFNTIGPSKGTYRSSQDSTVIKLKDVLESVMPGTDNKEAIDKLKQYYNIANDQKADSEDDYAYQISFALASAYIYDGQMDEAKKILNNIINDAKAPDDVKENARKLNKAIDKTVFFRFLK